MFRQAVADEAAPETTELLERVVREYPESPWADDALWLLGELAHQEGESERVAYYWEYLMSARRDVHLEGPTRRLTLYRRSGLPQVRKLLEVEGLAFQRTDNGALAVEFNAVPMTVWSGLGECYDALGLPEAAVGACDRALKAAPEGGHWRERCQQALQEAKVRAAAKRKAEEDAAANDADATRTPQDRLAQDD